MPDERADHILQGLWRETILLVIGSGWLLFIMTQPAFHSFFIAENFEYLGLYRTRGDDFWRALLSPTNRIFFRPVFYTFSLPWYFILPLEPWAYHLRNFAFSIINLLLLHRVLVRLVASRRARILALLFFALSKIHLTTIGYLNIFDAIVTLMLLLSTILFFQRYIVHWRKLDYILGLLFCFLSVFSKDYGLVVVFVVGALVFSYGVEFGKWRTQAAWWVLRLSPLVVMVFLYLGLRYMVVDSPPSFDPIYSPQLSFNVTIHKLVILTSTLGNLSLAPGGITGASGLGAWFTVTLWGGTTRLSWGDGLLCVCLIALLVVTMVRGAVRGEHYSSHWS